MVSIQTTIGICTYNMRGLLRTAFRSAWQQLCSQVEVVVIDDGSDDDTWSDLKKYSQLHENVRVYRNPKRSGLSHCRNQLLDLSRGGYLSILDADDILLPHKRRVHQTLFEQNPRVGVVWGRALICGPNRFGTALWPSQGFVPGWDLATAYQLVHSATTWRKSAVVSVGGFEPEWELVEAPHLFLKIGDCFHQKFSKTLDAVKTNTGVSGLRPQVDRQAEYLSGQLKTQTLMRRYGLSTEQLKNWEKGRRGTESLC